MEALSARSTNQKIRAVPMERKVLDRNAAAAAAAQKAASSKNHAPPPPSLVIEPEEDGERYSTGAFLGKGGFAICYEGTLLRNGRIFAMKVVRSEMAQKKMQEKFRTELQIHSKMRHPHIVGFHRAFTFDKCIYVILELCPNGSVMDMVRKRKSLSLPEVRRFMIQLCGAVKYLHKRNVAHRDLKMGNLFLDQNMDIKVGDFGLAAMIMSEKDEKRRKTLCGTPNYIAPEVLDKSKGGHTQKVDIWSLGVICFAMLTGYPPFQSKTQEEIYKKVRSLTYVWPNNTECANHIPEEAKSLVSSCLNLAENERPDPDDIVEHPFFNMYDGCIPKRLDPACCVAKPVWLRSDEPRGDRMMFGSSLEYDERLSSYIEHVDDPNQRYPICKTAFYSLCGVGRKPDGTARKAAGKNGSKSAFAECLAEEEKGLQPMIPLPEDIVYRYPHILDRDWSIPEAPSLNRREGSSFDSSVLSSKSSSSSRSTSSSLSRTQAALAAAQQRRQASQSHAATLRQQASIGRGAARKITAACELSAPPMRPSAETKEMTQEAAAVPDVPTGGLAERPIRARRGVAASYSGSMRDLERVFVPPEPKASQDTNMLTVGKTRSQSRRLVAASKEAACALNSKERPVSTALERLPSVSRQNPLRAPPRLEPKNPLLQMPVDERIVKNERIVKDKGVAKDERISKEERLAKEERAQNRRAVAEAQTQPVSRAGSKKSSSSSSASKPRSSIGCYPLFHRDDPCDILPRTSIDDVNAGIRHMLFNLVPSSPSRRRTTLRKTPHTYVVKWVDYTNRYGIGYVLDDGSVGCLFKPAHGQPATGLIMREGETHLRRKARSKEDPAYRYSENDYLVPRDGKLVELHENCGDSLPECRGAIRRAFISPMLFESVRISGSSSLAGQKETRTNSGLECARADSEKIRRLKLTYQFGMYMVGSLARHGEESLHDDHGPYESQGQFVKFYQRLGNTGVWGFGDGAFQFNFPDHTKLVISPGRTRSSSPWIDFYHLSPAAARYLKTHGRMHRAGFESRAITSEEAGTFLNIAYSASTDPMDERIREILDANGFLQKMSFIKNVLKGWVKHGRLGGGSALEPDAEAGGLMGPYWDGPQEKPDVGSKFVWVTVGGPGGDTEYRSVTMKKPETETDDELDALRERLSKLGAPL